MPGIKLAGAMCILCGGWMPDKTSDKMPGLATCIPFGWTCNFGAGNLPGGAIFLEHRLT
jgi:hypothetical protein